MLASLEMRFLIVNKQLIKLLVTLDHTELG